MPPRVKKPAGTPTPKKAAAKTPNKTPKSANKTPPPKPEPEIVENVEKPEEADHVEDVKVLEVPVKDDKIIEAEKLNERTAKDAAAAEKPAPVNESTPKKDAEEEAKPAFDEDDKGERLELDDNVSESEPEEDDEGTKDDAAAMDLDQDFVAQEDEEELLEDQLDEGEHDVDEGVDEEGLGEEGGGEGEEIEGEGEEEEAGEEHEGEEEEDEQHEVVKERRKRKEFEVFIGGLDKDAAEEDLRKVFSEVGEVVEIRLMMNPQTQKNKGFAFIRYATVEQAKRACTELKNPQVKGKVCGVSPSQDSDTLFLGNICKTWTKEALREKLKSFGVDNIEDLTLVEDPKNEGMNRGFAFMEFSARSDAMNAYKRLQKRDVVLGTDKTAKVSFAETFVEPDEEVMAQVKTVFVDGLPPSWDEDRIKEQFKKYGDIDKIQLARNMPSARRKDFGFVTFSAHDAAVACIDGVNNNGLGEGDSKVKVKARLSKPRQKGRLSKHGVRGGYKVGRGRGRGSTRGGRGPWVRAPAHFEPRRFASRGGRFIGRGQIGGRGVKRPLVRNAYPPVSERLPSRHLPPFERARDRRPPAPAYARSNSKRDYGRRDEPYDDRQVRSSRSAPDFSTRAAAARRSSYRDSYANRGSVSYSDNAPPRGVSRTVSRRPPYPEESYGRRIDKPYRDSRGRDYDTVSGSKRPYSAVEEPPRYGEPAMRNSRARLDYGVSASASQYGDYGESVRLGRGSQLGYGGSSARQDSYGLYDGHQSRVGSGYGGSKTYGSLGGSEAGGTYSSYGNDYLSSGADIGGGSYSSMYSSRSMGSGYLPGSGSGSYY
jgi:RNA recognition motif-containing protein